MGPSPHRGVGPIRSAGSRPNQTQPGQFDRLSPQSVSLWRDRIDPSLLPSTGPNPAGAIRRTAALRQRANPRNSPLRHRPQAQKSPRARPDTEPSLPVANTASDNPLHHTPYSGPRADRSGDANTRSVAGGSTTARSVIASHTSRTQRRGDATEMPAPRAAPQRVCAWFARSSGTCDTGRCGTDEAECQKGRIQANAAS